MPSAQWLHLLHNRDLNSPIAFNSDSECQSVNGQLMDYRVVQSIYSGC